MQPSSGNKAYAEDFDSFEQLYDRFDCEWCDSDDSVVFVSQHQLWGCLECCKASNHINVNGMRLGDYRTTNHVVSVLCVQDTYRGERVLFEAPYEAKADIMSASFEDTRRRWSPRLEMWTALPRVREELVVLLRGHGRTTIDFVALREDEPEYSSTIVTDRAGRPGGILNEDEAEGLEVGRRTPWHQ